MGENRHTADAAGLRGSWGHGASHPVPSEAAQSNPTNPNLGRGLQHQHLPPYWSQHSAQQRRSRDRRAPSSHHPRLQSQHSAQRFADVNGGCTGPRATTMATCARPKPKAPPQGFGYKPRPKGLALGCGPKPWPKAMAQGQWPKAPWPSAEAKRHGQGPRHRCVASEHRFGLKKKKRKKTIHS